MQQVQWPMMKKEDLAKTITSRFQTNEGLPMESLTAADAMKPDLKQKVHDKQQANICLISQKDEVSGQPKSGMGTLAGVVVESHNLDMGQDGKEESSRVKSRSREREISKSKVKKKSKKLLQLSK